jgi:cytosine/adenosine deaminase-related metal-dependent hydrolase
LVRSLAAHCPTTAPVFGSHYAPSTATLFEAAHSFGLRIVIREFHGAGRLLYAVTPRFQTHLNESSSEVARLFPDDADYLAVYERPLGRHLARELAAA